MSAIPPDCTSLESIFAYHYITESSTVYFIEIEWTNEQKNKQMCKCHYTPWKTVLRESVFILSPLATWAQQFVMKEWGQAEVITTFLLQGLC